jgi:hypothetical protein
MFLTKSSTSSRWPARPNGWTKHAQCSTLAETSELNSWIQSSAVLHRAHPHPHWVICSWTCLSSSSSDTLALPLITPIKVKGTRCTPSHCIWWNSSSAIYPWPHFTLPTIMATSHVGALSNTLHASSILPHMWLDFYFSVYFEGSPPAQEPKGILSGGHPPIFKCSHIPIKRQLFTCMEVTVLMGSPVVQEHPQGLISWGDPPSIRWTHSYRNLLYNILHTCRWGYYQQRHQTISSLNGLLMNTSALFKCK